MIYKWKFIGRNTNIGQPVSCTPMKAKQSGVCVHDELLDPKNTAVLMGCEWWLNLSHSVYIYVLGCLSVHCTQRDLKL